MERSRPIIVTPAPEPGSNHGSRCRRSRWRASSTAEATARTEAGPRLPRSGARTGGGRGDGESGSNHRFRSCVPPSRQRAGRGCPCFARIACGRGRVSAPARFARLIARARRRTHLSRLLTPGAFSAPSRSLSAETPKGGPGSRLSLLSSYTIPPNVKPGREQKMKTPEIFHEMPAAEAGGEGGFGRQSALFFPPACERSSP